MTSLAAAPPTPTAWTVLVATGYRLGFMSATGAGLGLAVLALPEGTPGATVARRLRRVLPYLATFLIVTVALHFASAVAKSAKAGLATGFSPAAISRYVDVTDGAEVAVQTGLFAVLAVAMIAATARPSRGLAWAVLVLAVAAPAAGEVPLDSPDGNDVARGALTGLHIVGASLWVGGLIVLALVAQPARRGARSGDGATDGGEEWARIWRRFSVVALYSVGTLLVTGSWLAWVHVGSPAQLVDTPYGRALGIKLLLVLVLLCCGAYNTRALLPRIRAARAAGGDGTVVSLAVRHFPVVTTIEAVLGVAVLFVVPFLAGSARNEAGTAAARSFDPTVFGSGVVLVALVAVVLWAGSRVRVPAVT
ncbi:copper resistance D family protein [Tsukamurella soli]|uniref:copper resistance D family protein n=1 Tax=Tsukamurella soli TaxID=644556 RepID=UPI0031E4FA36